MNCMRCGKTMDPGEEHTELGMVVCATCKEIVKTEVMPCFRCGYYLPRSELKFSNSQLFCNYCIMDVTDEKERQERLSSGKPEGQAEPRPHGDEPISDSCELCGRKERQLYEFRGRQLCWECYEKHKYDKGDSFQSSMIVKRPKGNAEGAGPFEFLMSVLEAVIWGNKRKQSTGSAAAQGEKAKAGTAGVPAEKGGKKKSQAAAGELSTNRSIQKEKKKQGENEFRDFKTIK